MESLLACVIKKNSCYLRHPCPKSTCDRFGHNGLVGVGKVPTISLLLECLRVRRDVSKHVSSRVRWKVSKHFNSRGLAQLVVANVVQQLTSSMPIGS